MFNLDAHEKETQDVLESIGKFIDQYAAFPNPESRDAVVLWVAHVWVYRNFEATPRLSVYSSEPGSGKTRVMDLVTNLAPKTVDAVNARPSMVYNMIEENDTVVFAIDEVDTLYGKRGSNNAGKQLTAVLNGGFYTDGTTPSGSPGNYREVSTSCPVVMAGMGRLPDALQSRSIRIPMRRTDADLEDYRIRKVNFESDQIKKHLQKWARGAGKTLELMFPEMPLKNRAADVWLPLFAIAELAGKDWTRRVNRAARLLESENAGDDVPLSTRLIRDIETITVELGLNEGNKIATDDIISGLADMGWDPRLTSAKALAKVYDTYGIAPAVMRFGRKTARGYLVEDLWNAAKQV